MAEDTANVWTSGLRTTTIACGTVTAATGTTIGTGTAIIATTVEAMTAAAEAASGTLTVMVRHHGLVNLGVVLDRDPIRGPANLIRARVHAL